MPKVSVLIPVYNVERYIARCAKSLFEQTLDDIEYIFVNDCTPDKSMDILNEIISCYPERKNQIRTIKHIKNRGLAAARNTGLDASSGEYIIHCDSDDWVEPEMYEEMYNKAIEEKSDVVICDFISEKQKISKYIRQYPETDPHLLIKSIFNQIAYPSGWNKLVKRNILIQHQLSYIENIDMCEDVLMATKLFLFTKRISYINKAFYHYNRTNPNSYVTVLSTKSLNQRADAIIEIERFYKEQNAYYEYKEDIDNLKILIKYLQLKQGNKVMSKNAISLFEEVNDSIFTSTMKTGRKIKLWLAIRCPLLIPALKKI